MNTIARWMIVISSVVLAVGCAADATEEGEGREESTEPQMERVYFDEEGNVGESADALRSRCLCCDLLYNICTDTCGDTC